MAVRITVILERDERDALCKLAEHEKRKVYLQAALIIREGLIRRGLLTQDTLIDFEPNLEKEVIPNAKLIQDKIKTII